MIDYLSLFTYLFLFLFGLWLDNEKRTLQMVKIKRYYLVLLALFLCFGYMTGGDWRGYELYYNDFSQYEWKFISEPASWLVFSTFPHVIKDYWLFSGLVKCFYFFSLLMLFKRITNYYVASIASLMQISLVFMLIGNPFRFMMALIPINYALGLFIENVEGKNNKKRTLIILSLLLLSALLHNSCAIFLLLFVFVWFVSDLSKINRFVLFAIFLLCIVITSNTALINSIKDYFNSILFIFGDVKDYSEEYAAEDTSSLFSIGNILQIFFFILVLLTRDGIIKKYELATFVYTMTVYFFFLDRILLLIPTGFRLAIPFGYFYAIYIVYMLKQYKLVGNVVVLYLSIQMTMTAWNDFSMIPYSSSIPYIVQGHLPFDYRYNYNFKECKKRTGIDYTFN